MLNETMQIAKTVEGAMKDAYRETGIEFNTHTSEIHPGGIRFV